MWGLGKTAEARDTTCLEPQVFFFSFFFLIFFRILTTHKYIRHGRWGRGYQGLYPNEDEIVEMGQVFFFFSFFFLIFFSNTDYA